MYDFHCHILPGIDDGCPDMASSLELGRVMAAAGFTHVALCQIGGDHQGEFIEWFERSLRPALAG